MSSQAVSTATVSNSKQPLSQIKKQLTLALAGNPNAGKTTLFNALTGLRQKVANYSGVTVERKEGSWRISETETARLIDLPGLYSLNAASIDEEIARDVLTGKIIGVPAPDCIIAVVDATNLETKIPQWNNTRASCCGSTGKTSEISISLSVSKAQFVASDPKA